MFYTSWRGPQCCQIWCHCINILVFGMRLGSALGSQSRAQNNRYPEGRAVQLSQIRNTWPRGESTDACPRGRMATLLSTGGMSGWYRLYVPKKSKLIANGGSYSHFSLETPSSWPGSTLSELCRGNSSLTYFLLKKWKKRAIFLAFFFFFFFLLPLIFSA